MTWKTVKIPQWAYEVALLAKGDALTGALRIPEQVLAPSRCPRCRSELELVTVGYQRVQCTSCNFKQERFEASGTNLTSLGIGVLLGLGLAALLASSEGQVDTRRTRGLQGLRRRARTLPPVTAAEVNEEIRAARRRRPRRKSA
jgi:hypothetical protein